MHLRPCTEADLYDYACLVGLAMWDDGIMSYTAPYRKLYPHSYFHYCLYRLKLRWYRGEFLMLCVSDPDDADWTGMEVPLGYCGYSTTIPGMEKPNRGGWLGNWLERQALVAYGWYASLFGLNWSNDVQAEQHFRSSIDHGIFDNYFASLPQEHRNIHGDQHWELALLGTHPDHRRKGVGKMMLQEGFRRAEQSGVPFIIFASIIGKQLYLSQGCREVGRVKLSVDDPKAAPTLKDLDVGQGKGNGVTCAAMVWEPPNIHAGTE